MDKLPKIRWSCECRWQGKDILGRAGAYSSGRHKLNNVKKSIGWADFTINPIKGLCPVACDYCYARRMYKRFKWDEEIRFDGNALTDFPDKPSRVFVGSTMELFGGWVKPEWMEQIMALPSNFPQHTFIFLTKRPENLLRWSPFPFNAYVGVSVTNQEEHNRAIACLSGIKASVKFISYEPLLDRINLDGAYDLSEIQWVIIGQQTPVRKATMPKLEWVDEIADAYDTAKVPVFLKENLKPLLPPIGKFYTPPFLGQDMMGEERMVRYLRQEFPK